MGGGGGGVTTCQGPYCHDVEDCINIGKLHLATSLYRQQDCTGSIGFFSSGPEKL